MKKPDSQNKIKGVVELDAADLDQVVGGVSASTIQPAGKEGLRGEEKAKNYAVPQEEAVKFKGK